MNAMIPKINDFEAFFGDIRRGMMLFNFYFSQVYSQLNRYLDLFKEIKNMLQGFLKAVKMIGMNRISTNLISNEKMITMINHVKEELNENYSNFELITDNEQDYY